MSKLTFLSAFIRNPGEVAAVSPSSKYVVNKVIKNVDFSNAKHIVEFGPGIGTVTKAILDNISPDAKLICFETNSKLCSFLDESIKDSRLAVINDTAENLDLYIKKFNMPHVDYIFSGLPFSLINQESKKAIIKKTKNSLRKGGKFIVYQQYNWHLGKYLNGCFNKILRSIEVRNIPPTFIYVCEKT